MEVWSWGFWHWYDADISHICSKTFQQAFVFFPVFVFVFVFVLVFEFVLFFIFFFAFVSVFNSVFNFFCLCLCFCLCHCLIFVSVCIIMFWYIMLWDFFWARIGCFFFFFVFVSVIMLWCIMLRDFFWACVECCEIELSRLVVHHQQLLAHEGERIYDVSKDVQPAMFNVSLLWAMEMPHFDTRSCALLSKVPKFEHQNVHFWYPNEKNQFSGKNPQYLFHVPFQCSWCKDSLSLV